MYDVLLGLGYTHHEIGVIAEAMVSTAHDINSQGRKLSAMLNAEVPDGEAIRSAVVILLGRSKP